MKKRIQQKTNAAIPCLSTRVAGLNIIIPLENPKLPALTMFTALITILLKDNFF